MNNEDKIFLVLVAILLLVFFFGKLELDRSLVPSEPVTQEEPECNKTKHLDSIETVGAPYGL